MKVYCGHAVVSNITLYDDVDPGMYPGRSIMLSHHVPNATYLNLWGSNYSDLATVDMYGIKKCSLSSTLRCTMLQISLKKYIKKIKNTEKERWQEMKSMYPHNLYL